MKLEIYDKGKDEILYQLDFDKYKNFDEEDLESCLEEITASIEDLFSSKRQELNNKTQG